MYREKTDYIILPQINITRLDQTVPIRHLAPLSTDEDLWTGVLLFGSSGHGRLCLGLRAFCALLSGGILDFDRLEGGLNTLMSLGILAFELGGVA